MMRATILVPLIVSGVSAVSALIVVVSAESRPRARDLGIAPGIHPPGALNAITDVAGVRVGHTTIVEGDTIRTGVTAVLPHEGNVFQDKVAGAVFVGNAFGKLAGSTQVAELGTIETPIVLTNTLSVGVALDAVVRYTLTGKDLKIGIDFSVNVEAANANDLQVELKQILTDLGLQDSVELEQT